MKIFPLVSVLMTAYNREKYIAEAIESVLASTYTNFELIIVDDGSTDNTVSIARSFEAIDTRVKVYVNETNLGDYPNRNRAASYAKGKYLKYLDSDDSIYPEGLSYCIEEMEKYPNSSFGLSMIDNDSGTSVFMNSEEVIRKHFFQSSHLSAGPTGMIIKRELFEKIGGFDPRFYMASDSFFNIHVASISPVVLLKQKFFYYRIHEGQEQNNPKGYFIYGYLANRNILKTLKLPLTKNEIIFLSKKNKKQHAVALIKHLIFKRKIKDSFFVMKQTDFGFVDIIIGLFYKISDKFGLKV
ncbi:MAG: glycosyltransferase family A protein [Bacteroidota bacterium]|nr:glycosyltransferase family A protein [Bacteroidota bacterium]